MDFKQEQHWIDQYINGTISREELRALEDSLRRHPELRAGFRAQLALDAHLGQATDVFAQPEAAPFPAARRRTAKAIWALAASLALAAVALTAWLGARGAAPAHVATLIQTDNCRWEGSTLPTMAQSRLGAGMLSLVEGIATLRFESGALVTIEAPTRMEIVSAMHCRLLEGSAIADVPESAHGFTVDTEDIQVVDLGTKFAVTTGATGNSQVRVFDGAVDVLGIPDVDTRRITTGQGVHVGGANRVPDHEMPRADASRQSISADGGWTSIATSYGRGADAYVRRGHRGSLGRDPLLMVKHTHIEEGRNNERRAILTFDLAGHDPGAVEEAQLVLDVKASGVGFSTMVPDSRFAVYGLLDEDGDVWSEEALEWDGLPGAGDEGVLPDRARKLAEFWIPRGGPGGPLVIRHEAIADFVRGDSNGLVTFLIVRETSETHSSGLAHAFASKEHPSGRPPLLRIR